MARGWTVIYVFYFDQNQNLVEAIGTCNLKSIWTTSIINQALPRPSCSATTDCLDAAVQCAPVNVGLSFQVRRSDGTFQELATQAPNFAAYFTNPQLDGATSVYRVCDAGSTFCSPLMPVAVQGCGSPPPPPPPHCPRGKFWCDGVGCVHSIRQCQ